MTRSSIARVSSLLCLAMVVLGASSPAAETPAPGYRIGPRDLIVVQVFEVPELNVERRVGEDGSVELPLVGSVQVQGMTSQALSVRLEEVLEERYVQHASVTVIVKEFQARPISVIGAVREPGPLAFSGRWTLLEAISAAGGLTDNHGNVVNVLRRSEGGAQERIEVDLQKLLVEADPAANISLSAGDLINVPATGEITISCLGEVERGGALIFKSTERITLLAAIARAGGLTERASNKILIRRKDDEGQDVALTANYKRIVAGKDPDVELRQDDVILIKQSFF